MSIVNPWILSFLVVAVGVPLVIHLVRRSVRSGAKFPMIWLMEPMEVPRRRFRQWIHPLLMVFRMLGYSFVILGFAGISLDSPSEPGEPAKLDLPDVVILDRSYSMGWMHRRPLARAEEVFTELLSRKQPGVPVWTCDGKFFIASLEDLWEVLGESDRYPCTLRDLLFRVLAEYAGEPAPSVMVLTDGQASWLGTPAIHYPSDSFVWVLLLDSQERARARQSLVVSDIQVFRSSPLQDSIQVILSVRTRAGRIPAESPPIRISVNGTWVGVYASDTFWLEGEYLDSVFRLEIEIQGDTFLPEDNRFRWGVLARWKGSARDTLRVYCVSRNREVLRRRQLPEPVAQIFQLAPFSREVTWVSGYPEDLSSFLEGRLREVWLLDASSLSREELLLWIRLLAEDTLGSRTVVVVPFTSVQEQGSMPGESAVLYLYPKRYPAEDLFYQRIPEERLNLGRIPTEGLHPDVVTYLVQMAPASFIRFPPVLVSGDEQVPLWQSMKTPAGMPVHVVGFPLCEGESPGSGNCPVWDLEMVLLLWIRILLHEQIPVWTLQGRGGERLFLPFFLCGGRWRCVLNVDSPDFSGSHLRGIPVEGNRVEIPSIPAEWIWLVRVHSRTGEREFIPIGWMPPHTDSWDYLLSTTLDSLAEVWNAQIILWKDLLQTWTQESPSWYVWFQSGIPWWVLALIFLMAESLYLVFRRL